MGAGLKSHPGKLQCLGERTDASLADCEHAGFW